ncbi:hypothetical protein NPIL_457101 [Nephila pilipes]|uniref:Uncharacterized protein n=1 Tax=Nephila pilipes TaxID=299642 RepID=A0A8X6PF12_NEPPI|nr:hypothetical protein NPIL_457101 [Nephila pilipes]
MKLCCFIGALHGFMFCQGTLIRSFPSTVLFSFLLSCFLSTGSPSLKQKKCSPLTSWSWQPFSSPPLWWWSVVKTRAQTPKS